MKELIFVSSVQKELAAERLAVRDFISGNRLLSRHFDVFLFEDLPAKDRRPDNLYLDKVADCSVFLALFAKDYGWEDPKDGISPTEREFDLATERGKHRLVFLKNLGNEKPHAKMEALAGKAKAQLVYRRFGNTADLISLVYDSLIEYLEERGVIQNKPFDAATCSGATMDDIAPKKIKWFLDVARRERNLGLPTTASPEEALTHLKLRDGDKLTQEVMTSLTLNDRQRKALAHIKQADRITNIEYQRITGTTKKTASRDLDDLIIKGVLQKIGSTGRGTYYVIAGKGDIKGTKGTS